MPKITKSQAKRMLKAIDSKASRLFLDDNDYMSTSDYLAIEKIVKKSLNKLK